MTSFSLDAKHDEDAALVERIGGLENGFELYRHRGEILEADATGRSVRLWIDDGVQLFEVTLSAGPIEWRAGGTVDVFYVAKDRHEHVVAAGDPGRRVWTPVSEVRRIAGILPVRTGFARARMLSASSTGIVVVGFFLLAAASQGMLGFDFAGAAALGVAVVAFLAFLLAESAAGAGVERRIAERLVGWRKL